MTQKFQVGQIVRSKAVGSAPWFVGEIEAQVAGPGEPSYIVRDYTTRRRWCREESELSLEQSEGSGK